MTSARILQINVSKGGVPKTSVPVASVAPGTGISIDDQADKQHHGGPLQDLCLFRLETLRLLQDEGHPIYPGAVGENLTIAGLAPEQFVGGVRLRLGGTVEVELTEAATPCRNIGAAFADRQFVRISEKLHPEDVRMYARVLSPGEIRPGDKIVVISTEEKSCNG